MRKGNKVVIGQYIHKRLILLFIQHIIHESNESNENFVA